MKRFCEIMKWIIASINAISCIILLFIICPRIVDGENLTFDYLGLLVGILAFLVAILLGWNIFYALEIKQDVKERVDNVNELCRQRLNRHIELNNKDFNNIQLTLKRCETFCNKIDEVLLRHLQNKEQ